MNSRTTDLRTAPFNQTELFTQQTYGLKIEYNLTES